RTFSFTRVRNVVQAFAPLIAQARDEQEAQQIHAKMMHYVCRAKIRNRNRKQKYYPRAVWGRPKVHPKRKASPSRLGVHLKLPHMLQAAITRPCRKGWPQCTRESIGVLGISVLSTPSVA